MDSQEYIEWAHDILKSASPAQADMVMNLRGGGWHLNEMVEYGYEDEPERDPPRKMFILIKGNDKLLVNETGNVLRLVTKPNQSNLN